MRCCVHVKVNTAAKHTRRQFIKHVLNCVFPGAQTLRAHLIEAGAAYKAKLVYMYIANKVMKNELDYSSSHKLRYGKRMCVLGAFLLNDILLYMVFRFKLSSEL